MTNQDYPLTSDRKGNYSQRENLSDCLADINRICTRLVESENGDPHRLFKMTQNGNVPDPIAALAETIGLLYVKSKAREFKWQQSKNLSATSAQEHQPGNRPRYKPGEIAGQNDSGKLIGRSKALRQIVAKIRQIARVPVTTLITGATGTGKEVVARMIHVYSPRRNRPFIPINCSAIPDNLFESEMFGIERGVATGVSQRMGHFEMADTGTLLLDEVREMSLAQQAKLLRVLETRVVSRLGKSRPKKVDIRVIAATNKNLEQEVAKKKFRQDLFYRLKVVHIHIPPLRQRKDDIPLMARHFFDNHRIRMGLPRIPIGDDAMKYLVEYPWPGNGRELNNEMEHAAVMVDADQMSADDLSAGIICPGKYDSGTIHDEANGDGQLPLNLESAERVLVIRSLKVAENNKSKAAKLLGISREGLRKKILRLGIDE